jgi:hypothetical protein
MPTVLPVSISEIIFIIFAGLAVLIPIIGLTARFALRPVVDAIARIKEAGNAGEALTMLERRMSLLEQEVQSVEGLRHEMARLADAQQFHMKLVGADRPDGE